MTLPKIPILSLTLHRFESSNEEDKEEAQNIEDIFQDLAMEEI